MRVGIFTESYLPHINGVSTSIYMLKKALEKSGHTVYIITVNNSKTRYEYDANEKVLRLPSLDLHTYDYRFTSIYPIKAMKKIRAMNLDIIHTHVEFTIGIFARVVSKQLGIPIVHTAHTLWEDYTHYISKGNKYVDKTTKELIKYLSTFFYDKTITELIVPTKKIYNLCKDKYKIKKNIHIVPTGIDVERFYKENFSKKEINNLKKEYNLSKKDFVILSLSRLAKEKSIDKLINNMIPLIKKHSNIKLLIVGDGPDNELLHNQVKELNLEKNVIFTGKVPLSEVQKYYQISNVFATASTTETQGLTVLEAMASSLPVIAISDEAFENTVIHELNGYIFNTDKEYIEDVLSLYEDKKLYEKFSNQSRILSNSHSSKYFGERIYEVYEHAIKLYNENNKKITTKISNFLRKGRNIIWKK